jgi:hypothetical protein
MNVLRIAVYIHLKSILYYEILGDQDGRQLETRRVTEALRLPQQGKQTRVAMPKGSIQEHAPWLRKNMTLCFVSNLVFEWGGNDEHYACSLETANLEHYAFKVSSRSVERKHGGGTEELH